MIDWWKSLFRRHRPSQATEEQLTALRISFQKKYRSFQQLLAANNKSLELMAELEAALSGERLPSMTFLRSRATRIATAVYQIIRHLNQISPGKYTVLNDRFTEIQSDIQRVLRRYTKRRDLPLVVPLLDPEGTRADIVGGKMAALGSLGRIEGVEIPKGFVMTTEAYALFFEQAGLHDEINRLIQSRQTDDVLTDDLSEHIEALVKSSDLPEPLELAMLKHYDDLSAELGEPPLVAVRSSAIGEDSFETSFAGQYRSVLNVDREHLISAYKQVIASTYTPQAMAYRRHFGIRDDQVAMCVGCMQMVEAKRGGVVYTRNPIDADDDSVQIYTVVGTPQKVVDGTADIETLAVSRTPPHAVLRQHVPAAGGCNLCGEAAARLARVALAVEAHFEHPQDIEWAATDSRVFLLQSRPLTALAPVAVPKDPDAAFTHLTPIVSGGITASRGVAVGQVVIVKTPPDIKRIAGVNRPVLVTPQALPVYATVLRDVAAVVTERGSAASHLATVAREFSVPALFGIENTTTALDDGGTVTVDADRGKIYHGDVVPIADLRSDAPLPRPQSPIHRALEQVAALIVPLELLDPGSPEFRPEKCRTLHDITRFCHEKSVEEMFRFGDDHHFPERASKRLFTDVATQFWVIDLDDGVTAGGNDPKFVRFENVVSVPMRALWRGMDRIRWSGPPPVDTRGFFQVLAHATMDTQLVAATPSRYAAGNHLLISKHYCSLQTRLGYHFSSVETLVGKRMSENYISFKFGGGGAAQGRKNRRARLIAALLDAHGFLTERRNDLVTANIGGYDQADMEAFLEIIGYLLVHTRQLDMVLHDEETLQSYRDRMTREIASFTASRDR